MPSLSSGNLPEGWVVLGAGLLMGLVVAGSLSWHAWSTPTAAVGASPGGDEPGDTARAETDRLEQELAALKAKLAEADTDLAFVRDSWARSKERLVEVQAQAELNMEQQRARTARLEDVNRNLRLEIEALQMRSRGLEDQVALLSEAAAGTASGRSTPSTGSVERGTAAQPQAEARSGRIRIQDANEALQYVVLTGGRDGGVQTGMLFTVLDGERPIADLRADDVREAFTGAVVERVYPGGRFPRPDDRVVVRKRIE